MKDLFELIRDFSVLTGAGVTVEDSYGKNIRTEGEFSEPSVTVRNVHMAVKAGPFPSNEAKQAAAGVLKCMITEAGQLDTDLSGVITGDEPDGGAARYSYAKEKELMDCVRTGSGAKVKRVMNELLGDVFFYDFYNIRTIRIRAMELSSLLSRVAIDEGASGEKMLRMNEEFMAAVEDAADAEEIGALLMRVTETFMGSMFSGKSLSEPVRRAIAYMAESLSSPVTLEITARQVGLVPTYFSAVFKKETGMTFREYLNRMRVNEAKRLLSHTNYDIVDIALATGFAEQSYFTRVFGRYTGLSPKKFRDSRNADK